MNIFILLLIITSVFHLTQGDAEDDEIEKLFQDLEDEFNSLYDNQRFKATDEEKAKISAGINDAKTKSTGAQNNGGIAAKDVIDIAKSIKDNLKKLKSGNPHEILDGGLSIAISVAAIIPPPAGIALTIVGALTSTVLSFFTPEKSETQKLLHGFKNILLTENDKVLKQEIAGEKNVIETELAILAGLQSLTDEQIDSRKIKTTTGDHALGRLAARIKSRAKDGTDSADSVFRLAVAYAEFAAYRDLALAKMVALLGNSGARGEGMVRDYQQAMRKHERSDYQEDLAIFYTNSYEYIDVLANYHPPEHNSGSKFLTSFMKTVGLPAPPVLTNGNFVVRSVKWPTFYFSRSCSTSGGRLTIQTNCHLVFKQGHPQGKHRIEFRRQANGYYRMQLSNFGVPSDPYSHDPNDPWKYVSAKKSRSSSVQLSRNRVDSDILILKFGNQITFSNRDAPMEYWNGRDSRFALYFYKDKDGYKDGKKFKLLSCNATRAEPCPDWGNN